MKTNKLGILTVFVSFFLLNLYLGSVRFHSFVCLG